jgi:5-oxoprolinase (ATP-hydrolysing)
VRLEIKQDDRSVRHDNPRRYKPTPLRKSRTFENNRWIYTGVFVWEDLRAGATINGPALIVSDNSTQFVETGWSFILDGSNNGLIERKDKARKHAKLQSAEAQLELYTNRFTSIAQNMGAMLQRTAFSVNVKERLDFSCALLDAEGNLIVNAPHIPVHLGSLGVCVRTLKKLIPMKEGDVIVTNHPAFGGSHLPDITLVKPVYLKRKLVGYVANRAHHAEIGGTQPGSTPAHAKALTEEGVIIKPTYLVKGKDQRWSDIESILTSARHPTRAIEENLSDLRAALASLTLGDSELIALCEQYSPREVIQYMNEIKVHAASLMRTKIKQLRGRTYRAIEKLDDGSALQVEIKFSASIVVIDFTGSSTVHAGNLNATEAIVRSVVIYVLRLLIGVPVPLNEGLMQDVKLILPAGMLNPSFGKEADFLPAVVGGNTEVSQRLTDTLLKALKLAACSQGTMNNFLFGDRHFGYYETIGGGTGASKGYNGADAVHQHMTNTRITDVEILEWRYPVRIERFEIRRRSGGKGKFEGGNGIIREFYFKKNLEVNILSQHRVVAPFGMNGGASGKTGEQLLIKSSGERIKLKGIESIRVGAGDRIVIKTPGGGAWGKQFNQ